MVDSSNRLEAVFKAVGNLSAPIRPTRNTIKMCRNRSPIFCVSHGRHMVEYFALLTETSPGAYTCEGFPWCLPVHSDPRDPQKTAKRKHGKEVCRKCVHENQEAYDIYAKEQKEKAEIIAQTEQCPIQTQTPKKQREKTSNPNRSPKCKQTQTPSSPKSNHQPTPQHPKLNQTTPAAPSKPNQGLQKTSPKKVSKIPQFKALKSTRSKHDRLRRVANYVNKSVSDFVKDSKNQLEIKDFQIGKIPVVVDGEKFNLVLNGTINPEELEKTVLAADLTRTSRRQYETLAAAQPDMQRSQQVRNIKKLMNEEVEQKIPLYPIKRNGEVIGYHRKLSEMLPLVASLYDLKGKDIKIKISGDGRKCGRRRDQVVILLDFVCQAALMLTLPSLYSGCVERQRGLPRVQNLLKRPHH